VIKRITLVLACFVIIAVCCAAWAKIADLAGLWYPGSPKELRSELDGYLRDAEVGKIEGEVIGLVAPHAGYRYSGAIAAYAYKAVMTAKVDTIVIVGFTHRRYLPGRIAVFTDKSFVTPLGEAPIDMDISKKLIAYDRRIQELPEAFKDENSVEMQIPLAQEAIKGSRMVLISIGDQRIENCRLLADALYDVLKDEKDFVMLASTDMCHYLPYDAAVKKDKETIALIEKFDPDALYFGSLKKRHELMCGYGAVYAVMSASKKLGADKVQVLKYANSGDTSGMKDKVVGYMSAAFIKAAAGGTEQGVTKKEGQGMFDQKQKKELLKIARDTIAHYLATGERLDVEVDDEALKQDMGAFVTLHEHGQLRGCIGHMAATGPLYLTVRDMAIAAATEDPRFPRVTADELDDIDIEISALSPMREIDDYNEIEVGKHGVMVRMGWNSGVYLPQVATETGWSRDEFMNSLCAHKAGIPADAWKTGGCEIYVFTAEVFGEKE